MTASDHSEQETIKHALDIVKDALDTLRHWDVHFEFVPAPDDSTRRITRYNISAELES